MKHSSTVIPETVRKKRVLITVSIVAFIVLSVLAYFVISAINDRNSAVKASINDNAELGITVDGVSYNTKAELTSAVNASNWTEPRYQCWTGDNFSDFDYYTDEILITEKHYTKNADIDTPSCMEIVKDIPQETIDVINNPDNIKLYPITAMMKQISVYTFDEYAMMEKKTNEYPNMSEDYYYYMAMKEYGSQVVAKKLNDITEREDNYIWTINDGAGLIKEQGNIQGEVSYRDGWNNAAKIAETLN